MTKKLAIFVAIVALLAVGASSVYAAPPKNEHPGQVFNSTLGIWVPAFGDGRINAFDMTEPVAVYYNYGNAEVQAADGTMQLTQIVTGIDVWYIDSLSEGQFDFMVTAAQIAAARTASHATTLGTGHGFTLSYDPATTSFTISGDGYSFTWIG